MKQQYPTLQRRTLAVFSVCLMTVLAQWPVLAPAQVLAQASELQVIELKYRTAEELIPTLQPLLEPGAALSGSDFTLFVRASKANVSQLRQVITQLDRRPRQFLVSVRNSTRQEIERERLAAAAVISNRGVNATVRATDTATQRQGNNVSKVAVLEGNEAFIAEGQNDLTSLGRDGGVRGRGRADVSSGFTVTPRLVGEDQVSLQIAQQSERRGGARSIDTQSLATQITGKLGEWIPLGASDSSATSTQSAILGRSYATQSDARSVWVKVELSP